MPAVCSVQQSSEQALSSHRCPSAVRCSLCEGTDSSSSFEVLAVTSNPPPPSPPPSSPTPPLLPARGDSDDDALELSVPDPLFDGGRNAAGKESTGARTRARERGVPRGDTPCRGVERCPRCGLGGSCSRLLSSVTDAFERFPWDDANGEGDWAVESRDCEGWDGEVIGGWVGYS